MYGIPRTILYDELGAKLIERVGIQKQILVGKTWDGCKVVSRSYGIEKGLKRVVSYWLVVAAKYVGKYVKLM